MDDFPLLPTLEEHGRNFDRFRAADPTVADTAPPATRRYDLDDTHRHQLVCEVANVPRREAEVAYHLDEARVQDDATALDRSRDEEKRLLGLRRRFVNPVGKANVHWFHDDTCAQGEDLLRRCIRGGGRRGERPSGHTTGTGDAGSPKRRRPGTSERARLCALEKPRVTGRDPRENRLNRPAKAERVARSSR